MISEAMESSASETVVIISSPKCYLHSGGTCDSPARIKATCDAIMQECSDHITCIEVNQAISEENVSLFHTKDHLKILFDAHQKSCESGNTVDIDPDCPVGLNTWDAVMNAAQCAIIAVDRVIQRQNR